MKNVSFEAILQICDRSVGPYLSIVKDRSKMGMGLVSGTSYIGEKIAKKICLRVCLRRWNDRGEFEIDRAKSKNNIAKSSIALGHETHNRQNF